jgi:hypothetical protein
MQPFADQLSAADRIQFEINLGTVFAEVFFRREKTAVGLISGALAPEKSPHKTRCRACLAAPNITAKEQFTVGVLHVCCSNATLQRRMALLAVAALGTKLVGDAFRAGPSNDATGAQSDGLSGATSKWNGTPTYPSFDAYRLSRRGTGAHDVTLNRPLVVKRKANPIVRPMRDIERRVHFRRQVGPDAAAWMQHMLAETQLPDPPFLGESKAVQYKRRLVQETMAHHINHPGMTIVDRELKPWNAHPMPMWYPNGGHPIR